MYEQEKVALPQFCRTVLDAVHFLVHIIARAWESGLAGKMAPWVRFLYATGLTDLAVGCILTGAFPIGAVYCMYYAQYTIPQLLSPFDKKALAAASSISQDSSPRLKPLSRVSVLAPRILYKYIWMRYTFLSLHPFYYLSLYLSPVGEIQWAISQGLKKSLQ